MSNISLCRICLASNVNFYVIMGTPLQGILQNILQINLSTEDIMPQQVCYICHYELKKCQRLIARAKAADQLLSQLVREGVLGPTYPLSQSVLKTYNFTRTLERSPLLHMHIQPELSYDNDTSHMIDTHIAKGDCIQDVQVKVEADLKKDRSDNPSEDADVVCEDGLKEEGVKLEEHGESHNSEGNFDSEDELPLNKVVKKRKGRRPYARNKQYDRLSDFAREIHLSKEEQLKELEERAKTSNYLHSPLKCTLCFKGFCDSKAYDNHNRKHDTSCGPFECSICHMRYETHRMLRTHERAAHSRRFACKKCGHTSHTANQARDHEKWHSGYTYPCKLCGMKFSKPTSYLTHVRKRHSSQHVCRVCGDSFVGRLGLAMHRKKAHRDRTPPENTEEPKSKRFCEDCDIQFTNSDAWKRHVLLTHYKDHTGSDNGYECIICHTSYMSSTALDIHLKSHRKEVKVAMSGPVVKKIETGPVVCEHCGVNFASKRSLESHVKFQHLGLRKNKSCVCELCGKKCSSNSSLKTHQRTHTGEKPYQCLVCPKKFSDSNQLRLHSRCHTGERPYHCDQCGKRFSQKPALTRHYRVHTGARPYSCPFCPKRFSQSNSLKGHTSKVHCNDAPKSDDISKSVTTQT